jgi:hypothetical protein
MLRKLMKKIRTKWHSDIFNMRSDIVNICSDINDAASRVAHQTRCELSLLCDLYGSDKGSMYGGGAYYKWLAHTYTPVYEYFFLRYDRL